MEPPLGAPPAPASLPEKPSDPFNIGEFNGTPEEYQARIANLLAAVQANSPPQSTAEGRANLIALQSVVTTLQEKQRQLAAAAAARPQAVPPPAAAAPPLPPAPAADPMLPLRAADPPPKPHRGQYPWKVMVAMVAVILLVGLAVYLVPAGSVQTFIQYVMQQRVQQKPLVVYQMVETLNSDGCVLVLPDDLIAGKFFGKYHYEELRTSMLWHMVSRNYSGICAQHVGVPLCYCMLDTRRFDADGNEYSTLIASSNPGEPPRRLTAMDYVSGRDYLEMFNQEVPGESVDSISKVQEANALCKESHWRTRYDMVVVSYLRPGNPPRRFKEVFSGTHSYNIQHFFDIQHGQTGCRDDAADLLRGRAHNPRSRTANSARVLMFDNPTSHRTYIASPPPPSPVPELPSGIPGHNDTAGNSAPAVVQHGK